MLRSIRVLGWTLGMLCAAGVVAGPAQAEPGLLLVAHGSPSPAWNKPVLALGDQVARQVRETGQFKAVRTAMMEFVQPDVPAGIAELEAAGCDRIIAVPLFVAPSGHTHFDVPAVLGVYSSPTTAATLREEGAKAARPKVPVVVTQTLAEGDVLTQYALAQTRKLSKKPADEALVLLAHGDPDHHQLVERMVRQIATACCGATGVGYADWAYIGVGQGYQAHGLGTIQRALENKKRVLVVGLYVSSSAEQIHKRAMRTPQEGHGGHGAADPLAGKEVVFSSEPIVAQPELAAWILKAASEAVEPAPAAAGE